MPDVKSNMTGTVWKILVKPGDRVAEDQDVIIVESMKMEMMVPSTHSGTVEKVLVAEGDFVEEGQVVLALK
jgi:acetyl-CoA carboxylase biotin carboxyl carrier protein